MAIRNDHKQNFTTLLAAAKNGDLALMECKDQATGEYRAVICLANRYKDGSVDFMPLGHLSNDDPFTVYTPPE